MAGTWCALSTTNELERINSKGIKHFALNTKKIDTPLIQSRNKGTGHLSFNPLFTVPWVDTKFLLLSLNLMIMFSRRKEESHTGQVNCQTSTFKTAYLFKNMEFSFEKFSRTSDTCTVSNSPPFQPFLYSLVDKILLKQLL